MSKKTHELSDDQIDDCVGSLGMSENSILAGPDEIRKAMRAVIAADRELRRGDPAMPVIAYLRADAYGNPVWTDDCVCQDPMFPSCPDGSDSDDVSMPMVRLLDAQAVIAVQAVKIEWLTKANGLLKTHAETAWARGRDIGAASNETLVREADKVRRAEHADRLADNERLTEALTQAENKLDTLSAERDALKVDAGRYRFAAANLVLSGGTRKFAWPIAPCTKAEWDNYIDAAIAKEEAK